MSKLRPGARNGSTPYHNVSKRWSLLRFSPDFKKWSTYLVCDEGKGAKWRDATKKKQPKNLQGCNKNIYISKSVCFLDGKNGRPRNGDKLWFACNGCGTWVQVMKTMNSKQNLSYSALPTWHFYRIGASTGHFSNTSPPKAIQGSRYIPSRLPLSCIKHDPFGNWYTPSRDPCSIMILEDK